MRIGILTEVRVQFGMESWRQRILELMMVDGLGEEIKSFGEPMFPSLTCCFLSYTHLHHQKLRYIMVVLSIFTLMTPSYI